jgi:hypothetical protein
MEIPQCTYVYRAAGETDYQLEGVCASRATLEFTPPGAHSTLADNDWSQLQLLNTRLVGEANALSLRLVFITRQHGVFVCALTRAGPLRVLEHRPAPCRHYSTLRAALPYVDGDAAVAHGAPVYSLLYSFKEEVAPPHSSSSSSYPRRHHYAFEGLSPIATRIVGVPLFLTRQRLQALQTDWGQYLSVDAPQHSRCHVRSLDETQPCPYTLRWLGSADGLTRV